jgi:hypothetical protein
MFKYRLFTNLEFCLYRFISRSVLHLVFQHVPLSFHFSISVSECSKFRPAWKIMLIDSLTLTRNSLSTEPNLTHVQCNTELICNNMVIMATLVNS